MSSSNATIYRQAAARLERVGWTQHTFKDGSGRECPAQAILSVLSLKGTRLPNEIAWQVRRHIERCYRASQTSLWRRIVPLASQSVIIDWNDELGRGLSEVLDMLRSLADKLDPPKPLPELGPVVIKLEPEPTELHAEEKELVSV